MRVRKKPWAEGYIKTHSDLITTNPAEHLGHWQERFATVQPLQIEIGIGKGQFIVEMARQHPEINFLGIEIQESVIAVALRKLVESGLNNVQLVETDGANVDTLFAPGEVDQLFLNFSDPWPKTRHAKRRLTAPGFLGHYANVLKPAGKIQFKTDNRGLFEYSLASFNNTGLIFDEVWLDLHHSDGNVGNVQTEYEEKFSQKGPIYELIAHFPQS
ncbi:tRNA (guanosine(46)-N7)-methyltransferase TrmB [Secundilactobacillus kimchicus]|uniref:tRNA (guanine-N(7)-)-methyltransferase n=1 Tax=Secundilactobacillus kimchicus JCM 15530 TaxID=1302272 RepID=A0A0R1I1P1_9LACO|nr:tRNA (guanosine(46)-N7)-methyltransferase TrmB [Secundilactobacillus kimchicus]KRK49207.1 S-adenosylmethionine-dependent methyltransferase [Secundilactobacillus kimchicus JCM 15530]MBT9672751.1 tRNA (guanosine(46)-N7)-methyltransferase TrmB [Secundilactobacillus kimchicus]